MSIIQGLSTCGTKAFEATREKYSRSSDQGVFNKIKRDVCGRIGFIDAALQGVVEVITNLAVAAFKTLKAGTRVFLNSKMTKEAWKAIKTDVTSVFTLINSCAGAVIGPWMVGWQPL